MTVMIDFDLSDDVEHYLHDDCVMCLVNHDVCNDYHSDDVTAVIEMRLVYFIFSYVIAELIETEKDYVKDLGLLVEVSLLLLI